MALIDTFYDPGNTSELTDTDIEALMDEHRATIRRCAELLTAYGPVVPSNSRMVARLREQRREARELLKDLNRVLIYRDARAFKGY